MYVNENITHGNIQPKLLPEQQSSSNTLCFLPTESGGWVGGTYKHINIILFGQGGGGEEFLTFFFLMFESNNSLRFPRGPLR